MNKNMQYVKKRVLEKLSKEESFLSYKDKYKIEELIDSMPNLDMTSYYGEDTFEKNTIGWISFVKHILFMISEGMEITLDNFKTTFQPPQLSSIQKTSFGITNTISEELLNKKVDLKSLIEQSEEENLLDEVAYADFDNLSEGGLRALGLIDEHETSLDASELKIKSNVLMPVVKVSKENFVITSPYTGSFNVCMISSNVWMDVDTGQEFRVEYTD